MGVEVSLLLLLCLCYSGYGIRIPLPAEFDGEPQGEVSVVVRDGGDKLLRSLGGASIPAKSLEVSFPFKRNHVMLHLVRNDDISTNVPLYTMNDNGFITREFIKDDQDAFLYQDISNGAGVLVQATESSYCLFGSFYVGEEEFFLEPSHRDCTDASMNSTFRVWKVDLSGLQFSDATEEDYFGYRKPLSRKHNLRFKRNVEDLSVETLFIIDYSIYSYWFSKVTVDNEAERPQATKNVIRQFYAFVINGMDVRYKNIPSTSSSFTLSVVFAGIYIADTASKSSFTEEQKVLSTSPAQADAFAVLNQTTLWIKQRAGLPEFDHAMMFSRYDFIHNQSSSIVGLAWIGAMCTPDSVSIVEDHFNFIVLTVAAHELGHSMNASHDGTDNSCNSTEMYVMAPFVGVYRGLLNSWNFSTCSMQYFTDFITSLNEEDNNCLRTLGSGHDPTALVPEINTLPGTLYDADEHCRHIVGEGSYFCRFPYNNGYSDICTILYCHEFNKTSCSGNLGGDGLLCGDKKWCISGVCTPSESAPSGKEECLYGDDPDFRLERDNSAVIKCQGDGNSVETNSKLCYEELVKRSCCKTCSTFYTGISGCEFGDKNSNCSSMDCDTNAGACCQTCLASTNTALSAETTKETVLPPVSSPLTQEVTTESVAPELPTTSAITNTETYSTSTATASTSLTSSKSLASTTTSTSTLSSTSANTATSTTLLEGSTTSSQSMTSSTPPLQTSSVTTSTTSPTTIKTSLTSTASPTTSATTSPTTITTTSMTSTTSPTTSTTTSPTTITTSSLTSTTPPTSATTSPTTTTTTSPTSTTSQTTITTTSLTSSSPTTSPTSTTLTTTITTSSLISTTPPTSATTSPTTTTTTSPTSTTSQTITTTSLTSSSPTTITTTSPTSTTLTRTITTSSLTSTTPPTQSTTSTQTTYLMTTKTQTSTSLSTQTASTSTPLSTIESTTSPSTLAPTTQRKMNFQVKLNVDERRDLSSTEVLNDSKEAMTNVYTDKLGESFIKVEIKSIRSGSLIVDHDIYVVDSRPALLEVVDMMKNISEGKTNVTYNGNDVNALSVSFTDASNNQVLINDRTDSNAVIDASFICIANELCSRDPTTTPADNGLADSEIIIIASVSAAVGLMITVAIVIIICTCRRKPKKTTTTTTNREFKHFLFSKNTTDLLNSSSAYQNVAMDNMPSTGHHDDIKGGHYARVNRVPTRQRDVYGAGYDVRETPAIGQNDSYSANDGFRDDRTRKPDGYRTERALGDSNISNEQHQNFRTNDGASYDREPRQQTGRIQNTQLGADFRVNKMIQNRRHDVYRYHHGASEAYNTSGDFKPSYNTRDDAIVSRQTDIYRTGHNSKMERISSVQQGNTGYNSRESGIESRYPHASGYAGKYRERMDPSPRIEFDVRNSRDKSRVNVADKSHDRSRGNVADKSHDRSRGNGAEYGRRWYPGYEQYLSENDLWKLPSGSFRHINN